MSVFSFIGCGNMGSALASAACKGTSPQNILLANRTPAKAEALADKLCCTAVSNTKAAEDGDFIFLGVKPQMMAEMLGEISPILKGRTSPYVLVTMAAGLTIDTILEMAQVNCPVIRIMPNTPASIGKGMMQYCCRNVQPEMLREFLEVMDYAGRWDSLPENLIDAASAVSGCGPAYAYLFIEALADGGVACGLPRAKAMEYAAQMLAGSAEMVLTSDKHPGELKDAVCSPGGTTIQGVRALEENGFRSAAMEAVIAAYEKSRALAKK